MITPDRQQSDFPREVTAARAIGVRCQGLSVSYGDCSVFDNLHLEFKPGEWTCLLGPSGCGKSTLLRIISGTKDIQFSGSISFSGKKDACPPVAWMSQKDLLLPWLTVLDNIIIGAKLRNEVTEDVINQATELLDRAGLAGSEKRYPPALSGGMRQRVALLRTLMEKRPVLLMDEPFSALDALTRLKLQNLSVQLVSGKTVILVTHDPHEALRLGNRIVVLGGTPAGIIADIKPKGLPPRQSDNPSLIHSYSSLLEILLAKEKP